MRITDYLDYRKFLQDFYQQEHNRSGFFSYRYMAQKLDMDPSFVIRVLQGKRHLPERAVPAVAKMCRMDSQESAYLERLILFCKARSDKESQAHYDQLMALRPIPKRTLSDLEYSFYAHWHHAAMRALLEFAPPGRDPAVLGALLNPPIDSDTAQRSVELLEKLKLIRWEGDRAVLTAGILTTAEKWKSRAIENAHKEALNLAVESLERHPKEMRDISTMTLGMSSQDLPALRELTREYREAVLRLVCDSPSPADRVYQLDICLFPLSQPVDAGVLVGEEVV